MTDEPAGLEIVDQPDPAANKAVLDGLLAHNRPHLGPPDHRFLGVYARAGGGELLGGLVGETGRGFLTVDLFWVDERERGKGLGSRLLAAAEVEAAARGCLAAWLDTYSFQARPFYERHGYTLFAELGGFPNGHRRLFMAKRLATAPCDVKGGVRG